MSARDSEAGMGGGELSGSVSKEDWEEMLLDRGMEQDEAVDEEEGRMGSASASWLACWNWFSRAWTSSCSLISSGRGGRSLDLRRSSVDGERPLS